MSEATANASYDSATTLTPAQNDPPKKAKSKARKVTKKSPAVSDEEKATKDRARAKAADLTLVQYRILAVLVRFKRPMTYRDIEAKTGYYSILTAQLRASSQRDGETTDHEGSLGSAGLVREMILEGDDGRSVIHFKATAKGVKRIEKSKTAA